MAKGNKSYKIEVAVIIVITITIAKRGWRRNRWRNIFAERRCDDALCSLLGHALVAVWALAVGLALTIWGEVMGINAILVGTLSDESADRIKELHDAYVGVVAVLARYLNSSDPKVCDRTAKTAQLSRQVAAQMRLSDNEIDDIRVAALLQDIENIEVTARVIRKAVGDLAQPRRKKQLEHTFHGSDLVQSLGSVLTGALPLLGNHGEYPDMSDADAFSRAPAERGFGAQITHTVRAYVTLL
jgi:hypothetical protein